MKSMNTACCTFWNQEASTSDEAIATAMVALALSRQITMSCSEALLERLEPLTTDQQARWSGDIRRSAESYATHPASFANKALIQHGLLA